MSTAQAMILQMMTRANNHFSTWVGGIGIFVGHLIYLARACSIEKWLEIVLGFRSCLNVVVGGSFACRREL